MKVIVLKDDTKLGKKYTVIEVADSYAKNVLIPKHLVEPANSSNLNKLSNALAKEKREFELKKAEAEDTKKKIEELKEITIIAKCSSAGKMFGAVTSKDISEVLAKLNIKVRKQDIELPMTIKYFGMYKVIIKLFDGLYAELNVKVVEQ